MTIAHVLTAKQEDADLRQKFGEAAETYAREVGAFVPRFRHVPVSAGKRMNWNKVWNHKNALVHVLVGYFLFFLLLGVFLLTKAATRG